MFLIECVYFLLYFLTATYTLKKKSTVIHMNKVQQESVASFSNIDTTTDETKPRPDVQRYVKPNVVR